MEKLKVHISSYIFIVHGLAVYSKGSVMSLEGVDLFESFRSQFTIPSHTHIFQCCRMSQDYIMYLLWYSENDFVV